MKYRPIARIGVVEERISAEKWGLPSRGPHRADGITQAYFEPIVAWNVNDRVKPLYSFQNTS